MKHKLITIGYLGYKNAYLDVPKDQAIARWLKDNPGDLSFPTTPTTAEELEKRGYVHEIAFDDEFYVYDVWKE